MPEPFASVCHVGPAFVPCDPAELGPLLDALAKGEAPDRDRHFPRGTWLADGRLDLCKQSIGPAGARAVMAALRHDRHVRHLLLGADGLGDDGAAAVAELAAVRADLRTVYLGCNDITGQGARALAEAVARHPGVTGLWLKRNPLGLEGARAVARLLAENTTLRVLDLVNTDLGPEGARIILEAARTTPAPLERLYLGGNRLGPAEAVSVGELLTSRPGLLHLSLSVNEVGDEGIRRLAVGLKANRTLHSLGLGSNGLGPQGAWALAQALRAHPDLRALELGQEPSAPVLGAPANAIGDEGAACLAELLKTCPRLATLDLGGNGLTEDALAALTEAARGTALTRLEVGRMGAGHQRRVLQGVLDANRTATGSEPPPEELAVIRSVYRTAGR